MGGRLLDWLGQGDYSARPLAADMPAKIVPDSTALYYSTDNQLLSVYDQLAADWFEINVALLAGVAFAALPDVDWSTPPTDGQMFVWDAGASKLIPADVPVVPSNDTIIGLLGTAVVSGGGLTVDWDDALNILTITNSQTQYTDELAQDALAAAFAAGTHIGITVAYNDAGNAISFEIDPTYVDDRADARIAAASINDLSDVDTTTTPPTDGQVLKWDAGGGKWIPGSSSSTSVTTPTIRASKIQSSSASSYALTWPTGTLAGDVVIVMAGHGFGLTMPNDWLVLDNTTGTNWNGGAWAKQMTAADITAGGVTLTAAGSFNGVIAQVTLTGKPGEVRFVSKQQNGSGSGTRKIQTPWTPKTTDLILAFGSHRNADAVTCSFGTQIQQQNATAASAVLTEGSPASDDSITATWTYPTITGTTGDYQVVIAFKGL